MTAAWGEPPTGQGGNLEDCNAGENAEAVQVDVIGWVYNELTESRLFVSEGLEISWGPDRPAGSPQFWRPIYRHPVTGSKTQRTPNSAPKCALTERLAQAEKERGELLVALRQFMRAADWWAENQDSPKSALHHFMEAAKVADELVEASQAQSAPASAPILWNHDPSAALTSVASSALSRMERAEWSAVLNALRDARTYLCKDGVRQTWLDGAVNLAEERAKGKGAYADRAPAANAAGQAMTVQEVWLAAGGNPGIQASKQDVLDALKAMDEAVDECDEKHGRAAATSTGVLEPLRAIGHLIATQDNRYTDQPMFIVQQRRRMTGLDPDYCDNIVWLCSEDDFSEASAEEAAELEATYQETGRAKNGWTRTGYVDQWEFVAACFTEQGCKDYLAKDGHNLKEPRIYAEGSYRNDEFRAVRNALLALAQDDRAAAKGTAGREGE